MGCGQGKAIDDNDRLEKLKRWRNRFPACCKSINLTKETHSLVQYDSNQIFLGARDELQLLDLKTDNISTFSTEHKGRINILIKLKDGCIVSGGQDKTIKVWNIKSNQSLMTLTGHKSMIWSLCEINENKLLSGSSDKTAIIWDLNKKQLDFELYKDKEISSVLQLKNGNVLLCSENDLCLFDIKTKKKLANLEIPTGIWCMKELHDGRVAIGKGNGEICILEINNDIKITLVLKGHNKSVNAIIELDSYKLVSAADENNMILWNLDDPEAKYFIEGHTDKVMNVIFLGEIKFASISKDKTLKIWE
jgi:WD40 repeat protein